ncbi:MAG: SUMF1/EgtB/PvdO family nonheme iron enzyme, partial [Pseudomonas sp.]|nr:SUMF1/EgtB/PvdO family nonheme iron enzyme [Pseudomonas sp.]
NMSDNSDIRPVGAYPPNPLGLHDMAANAVSWVNDWYAADYYANSPVDNPQGPATGTDKVQRGGTSVWTPSASMTMRRLNDKPVLDEYYAQNSYRCTIQQSGPLK